MSKQSLDDKCNILDIDTFIEGMNDLQAERVNLLKFKNKHYKTDDTSIFSGFEAIAKLVGISREKVLLVFLLKHVLSMCNHVKGNKYPEGIKETLKDCMNYLDFLMGMYNEQKIKNK